LLIDTGACEIDGGQFGKYTIQRGTAPAGINARYVFTYRGSPIYHATTKAWVKALERAEIEAGFTFHDLRHIWASWHVMEGTPIEVLQKLGGWADAKMVLRYAHLAPSYVAS
jgi:integrase